MRIQFFLNTNEDVEIVTFRDLKFNPFNLGDEIELDVIGLYKMECVGYEKNTIKHMLEENEKLRSKFHLKTIKLVEENKYVTIRSIKESSIVIEYHCDIVE